MHPVKIYETRVGIALAEFSSAARRVTIQAADVSDGCRVAAGNGADRVVIGHLAGLDLGAAARARASILDRDRPDGWLSVVSVSHVNPHRWKCCP